MTDPWDFDSRHPANGRSAEFGHKRFVCQLVDSEGETLTFLGSVDYRVNELGLTIEKLEFFPHYGPMRESIEDWVRANLF